MQNADVVRRVGDMARESGGLVRTEVALEHHVPVHPHAERYAWGPDTALFALHAAQEFTAYFVLQRVLGRLIVWVFVVFATTDHLPQGMLHGPLLPRLGTRKTLARN